MDAQFEKDYRCNVDYEKAGHPRKSTRYRFPSIEMEYGCTNPVLSDILAKKREWDGS